VASYASIDSVVKKRRPTKEIGLKKTQLFKLKRLLLDSLGIIKSSPEIQKKTVPSDSIIYEYQNETRRSTATMDYEKIEFVLENGRGLFEVDKRIEKAREREMYFLKKNLDSLILGIIHETMLSKPMPNLARPKLFVSNGMGMDIELLESIESAKKVYSLNRSLIDHLRNQILIGMLRVI
jgi:hypothetical protein